MNTNDSFDNGENTPNASELLDFEPLTSPSTGGRSMLIGVAVAIILASAGVGAFFYFDISSDGDSASGPVPLILPPAGEVKSRPENPGGMAIPDRDKLVYGRIDGTANAPKIEQLLPPPETPLEPPADAPTENVVEPADETDVAKVLEPEKKPTEQIKAQAKPIAPPPAPEPVPTPTPTIATSEAISLAPPPPAPSATAEKPVAPPAPEPVPAPMPTPEPAVKAEIKPTQPEVRASGTGGSSGFMVQLSALKTEDAAKAEWSRVIKQNGDILGSLSMNIQRADLGAKGVFWRLRAAYLPDRKSAEDVCSKLAARGLGCLIIAP